MRSCYSLPNCSRDEFPEHYCLYPVRHKSNLKTHSFDSPQLDKVLGKYSGNKFTEYEKKYILAKLTYFQTK